MSERWIIRAETERDESGDPLYWSNLQGWVDRDSASWFPAPDVTLPWDGVWERITV